MLCKGRKVMKNELILRSLKLTIGFFVFIVIFNQLAGWAITEKSWIEKLWITIIAGGGFGVLGGSIGLVIGGIGLALGGGAIGLAGWLAFGVLGFGVGALGGSVWTIIQNPQNYDFDYFRLSIVVLAAGTTALASVLFSSTLGKWVKSYIKGNDELERVEA